MVLRAIAREIEVFDTRSETFGCNGRCSRHGSTFHFFVRGAQSGGVLSGENRGYHAAGGPGMGLVGVAAQDA